MRLTLAEKSCSCLVDSHFDEVIAPGCVGRVNLSSTIGVFNQQYQWSARYRTGLDDAPEITLTLRVHGYPRVTIEPELFPRYELLVGDEQRVRFVVTSFQRASEASAGASAAVDGTGVLELIERQDSHKAGMVSTMLVYDLVIRCAREHGASPSTRGFVERITASQGSQHSCQAMVHWVVSKAIKATPKCVWVKAAPNTRAEKAFVVQAEEPFAVLEIESSDRCARAHPEDSGDNIRHVIQCEFASDLGSAAGARALVKGTFRVRTNNRSEDEIIVPWFVFRKGGPSEK